MTGPLNDWQAIAPFRAYPWQLEPWRDTSSLLILTGSAGGGKSRLAGEKINAYCKRYPGAMGLMLRKKRESMTNSTVLFMDREIMGPDPSIRHLSSKSRFEYNNGSILAYGGMKDEEQREQIRSIGQAGGVDIAWMEEAIGFTETDLNELLARMRGRAAPWRQIILTTNPSHPSHFIKKRLMDGKQAAVYYSRAQDNPANPDDYLETLDGLTGVIGKRLRDGLWCIAEGAVYDEFDHRIHMAERPSEEMQYYVAGCDEGYTNPGVFLVIGVDSDGRLHICREFYKRRVTQEQFIEAMVEEGDGIHAFSVDPSAAGLIAAMRKAGLPARKANNAVFDGIQAVKGMLAVAGDGRPRLTIDPSCVNTIAEFESYAWKESRTGTKDEPEKENDHAMDALRYAIMGLGRVIVGDIFSWV